MQRIPRFRQSSLHTLQRRVGARLRSWLLQRFVPTPAVKRVRFGGTSYKRITFLDAWRADSVADVLEEYREDQILPGVVVRFENELMVEYIQGELSGELDDATLDALARFFGVLYARGARRVPTAETRFAAAAERDLAFLQDVGVLREALCRELVSKLPALTPAEVWVGTEYIDSLPKNFVCTPDGRLVAIDVDALHRDELLGVGVSKALLDATPDQRERFFRTFEGPEGLDLAPLMPFIDLCFLASWTKLLYLKGRARRIDPARFDALLASRDG